MAEDPRPDDNNVLQDFAGVAADQVQGERVAMTGSAAKQVEGGQVTMTGSSAGAVKAHALHMENSAAGAVAGGAVEVRHSAVGAVAGREVTLQATSVGMLAAQTVQATNVRTVALLAGQVRGNVETVFTLWTALAAGAGLGVALFGLRALVGRPARRAAQKENA
jgi:hypothetical protein